MATLHTTQNHLWMMALIASFSYLVFSNPVQAQERAVCYQDNCLRQLSHNAAEASPYCMSVVGTITATVTQTTTVPALDGNLNLKRTVTATTSTPTFVSHCTENPTAVFSGCSCFLGTIVPTTTTTTTSTSTLPLPSQCSASNNYGFTPNFYQIYVPPGSSFPGSSGLGFNAPLGGCCSYCFSTPNCIGFYTYQGPNPPPAGEEVCSLEILGGQAVEPVGQHNCPSGTATLTSSAVAAGGTFSNFSFGVGPCGTVVPVPAK